MGAVISCGNFQVGESYHVYMNGTVTGSEVGGVYDPAIVTGYEGGVQQAYTGTDVMMRPGGMGGFGGQRPDGKGGRGERPEGEMPAMPDDWTHPEGEMPTMPEGWTPPQGEMPTMPEDWTHPDGEMPTRPDGEATPHGGFGGFGGFGGQRSGDTGEAKTEFYMQDKVNFFSGLAKAE